MINGPPARTSRSHNPNIYPLGAEQVRRFTTCRILDLSRQKKLPLPGDGSLRDLKQALTVCSPSDLVHFLSKFKWTSPSIAGDLTAIERVAFEFVLDEAAQGVLYTEPRLSPHLLMSADGEVTARHVLQAVLLGLGHGQAHTGTTARLILCCIRGMSENYASVLDLCTEFRGQVVGMDIAGNEDSIVQNTSGGASCLDPSRAEVETFQEAARRGIHRTVHAGEAGPARMVQRAMDELKAERIGHGYHVLEDEALYRRCLEDRIHFECCPTSSYMTAAVSLTETKHPVQRFCEDGMNFSISEDDPIITQAGLDGEYALLRRMGFNEANLATVNFNAAKASFLPEEEKQQLIKQLRAVYGVPE